MRASPSAPYSRLFDGLAIGVSGLCVVHCLVLPLALVLLPNVSLLSQWPEALHMAAAGVAAASSIAAIAPRWAGMSLLLRQRIGGCAALGIALLMLALLLPFAWAETGCTVIGSGFLVYAHLCNLKH